MMHLREILEDDSSWSEGNLHILRLGLFPVEDVFHIGLLDQEVVAVPDSRFQQDTDGKWETP